MAFAIARQRRSARRENGPVRIGFTGFMIVGSFAGALTISKLQAAGVGQWRHGFGRNGRVEGLLCVRVSRHAGFVPAGRLLVDGGAWVRRGSLRTVQRVGTYGHGDDRLRTQGKNTLRHFGG